MTAGLTVAASELEGSPVNKGAVAVRHFASVCRVTAVRLQPKVGLGRKALHQCLNFQQIHASRPFKIPDRSSTRAVLFKQPLLFLDVRFGDFGGTGRDRVHQWRPRAPG